MIAIIGELYADAAGVTMLLEADTDEARDAARMLVFDRVAREAWLPKAALQVDSITARHLLVLLADLAGKPIATMRSALDIDRVGERLGQELPRLADVEAACADGNTEPARRYLASYGWELGEKGYQVHLDGDLPRFVSRVARTIPATPPQASLPAALQPPPPRWQAG